jgi:thioredoxin 1
MEKLTSVERFHKIIKKHKYVFVDICAEWCGPCKKIAPKIESLALEYNNIKFVTIDCDEFPKLCKSLEVRSLPTFILFEEGYITNTIVGANIEEVVKILEMC